MEKKKGEGSKHFAILLIRYPHVSIVALINRMYNTCNRHPNMKFFFTLILLAHHCQVYITCSYICVHSIVLPLYAGFFHDDGSIRHSGPTHSPTGVSRDTLEKIGHVFSNVPEELSVHSGEYVLVCTYVWKISLSWRKMKTTVQLWIVIQWNLSIPDTLGTA